MKHTWNFSGKLRLVLIRILYGSILAGVIVPAFAGQEADSVMVRKIFSQALTHDEAYRNLNELCMKAPGRISGSPALNTAILLTGEFLKKAGADTVYFHPVTIPNWKPGSVAEAVIKMNGRENRLHVLPLGNSVGTPGEGITAGIVEVQSFDELNQLGRDRIAGRIVFYNRPMDATLINTFAAYGGAADQRVSGASRAAAFGAVAVLVRSLTTRKDTFPHAGQMRYQEEVKQIPALAVATLDADSLSQWLRRSKDLICTLRADCHALPDTVGYNVIGEIRGIIPQSGIMMAGGHLDAWYNTYGAHDDASGCIQAIEVIRLFKSLGIQPRHTIRAVMFMDEEIRQTGGREYALHARLKGEKHLLALESDRGGLLPRGFSIDASEAEFKKIKELQKYFLPYFMNDFIKGGSGTDVAPLKGSSLILAGLYTDGQRYFDYHHSAFDTPDQVNFRELQLGSAAIAALFYLMDRRF